MHYGPWCSNLWCYPLGIDDFPIPLSTVWYSVMSCLRLSYSMRALKMFWVGVVKCLGSVIVRESFLLPTCTHSCSWGCYISLAAGWVAFGLHTIVPFFVGHCQFHDHTSYTSHRWWASIQTQSPATVLHLSHLQSKYTLVISSVLALLSVFTHSSPYSFPLCFYQPLMGTPPG